MIQKDIKETKDIEKRPKEYKIKIDTRILELLGPHLYTNIYYVLAELIANSYDAGAGNVYIIQKKDSIIVEDDGIGMSYNNGGIAKYLNVAVETRTTEEESYITVGKIKRKKMGRKGVGKLAALSVSEDVLVMTKQEGEKSGFILSRKIGSDNKLTPLIDDEISFEKIAEKKSGTSIIMTKPEYGLHKSAKALRNNLVKIFPLVNSQFKIHIITDKETIIIEDFNKEIIGSLGGLITLGKEYESLGDNFDSGLENKEGLEINLLKQEKEIVRPIFLKNKEGEEKEYSLRIKGWIGIYKSTRGRKADLNDFPDNFISLLSNGKLGEYNILPIVGKNYLLEVFIVGQLHIDLFEETELPDMSLSNRQGYKTDDKRYEEVIYQIRKILPKIINLRVLYAGYKKEEKERSKTKQKIKDEEELKKKVENYKKTVSQNVMEKMANKLGEKMPKDFQEVVENEVNAVLPMIGLKSKIDSQKKRILISHTGIDKPLCDVIYKMLSFNNVPDEDILYTNCENEDCWIPSGSLDEPEGLFDYLRRFFVDSYSDEKIFVIYVTSDDMAQSWNAVSEVGAGWITQSNHSIFNINDHHPQAPLNLNPEYQVCKKDENGIKLRVVNFNKFAMKIVEICQGLGYSEKDIQENKKELGKYVSIED